MSAQRAALAVPDEGGWLCNPCNVYFPEDRETCPHCEAAVDHMAGVAR